MEHATDSPDRDIYDEILKTLTQSLSTEIKNLSRPGLAIIHSYIVAISLFIGIVAAIAGATCVATGTYEIIGVSIVTGTSPLFGSAFHPFFLSLQLIETKAVASDKVKSFSVILAGVMACTSIIVCLSLGISIVVGIVFFPLSYLTSVCVISIAEDNTNIKVFLQGPFALIISGIATAIYAGFGIVINRFFGATNNSNICAVIFASTGAGLIVGTASINKLSNDFPWHLIAGIGATVGAACILGTNIAKGIALGIFVGSGLGLEFQGYIALFVYSVTHWAFRSY